MAVTLTVAGQIYTSWTAIRVTRGLKRAASDFSIEVTEAWAGTAGGVAAPWRIPPFAACVVADDGDPILTGYVDDYLPSFGPADHRVAIAGRSRTCDLIDCMPLFDSNQFKGYTLAAMAKALGAAFGVGVVVQTDVGGGFPDATFERAETAFDFLENLARMRGILLTDDEHGNLVLTVAGSGKAAGALIQGENVLSARGKLSGRDRFSQYTIRSQVGMAAAQEVDTAVKAIAKDPAVPRFRPWADLAESMALTADAQLRANWERAHRAGEAISATLTVPEWRQPNGTLWKVNQLVPVKSPYLEIDTTLLISKLGFLLDAQGKRTEITVSPPSAFTPEPITAAAAFGGGTNPQWDGVTAVKE